MSDDHGHTLVGLGLQLVGRRRERLRGDVKVHACREPGQRGAGGEANDDPCEETACDAVDEWNEDGTERKGCDPRQVPLRANVRPSRVALSGLRMRVTEGALVADPVLYGSV